MRHCRRTGNNHHDFRSGQTTGRKKFQAERTRAGWSKGDDRIWSLSSRLVAKNVPKPMFRQPMSIERRGIKKTDAAAVAGLQRSKRPLLREYARRDREGERRPIQALRPPMRSCQRVAAEASSSCRRSTNCEPSVLDRLKDGKRQWRCRETTCAVQLALLSMSRHRRVRSSANSAWPTPTPANHHRTSRGRIRNNR